MNKQSAYELGVTRALRDAGLEKLGYGSPVPLGKPLSLGQKAGILALLTSPVTVPALAGAGIGAAVGSTVDRPGTGAMAGGLAGFGASAGGLHGLWRGISKDHVIGGKARQMWADMKRKALIESLAGGTIGAGIGTGVGLLASPSKKESWLDRFRD
jgi:hypothetical protein